MGGIAFIEVILFTKHLSIMIKSGVPILEAVEILSEQTKSVEMKKVLIGVEKDIKNGASLVMALSKYPKVFSSFYISMITVAEESGKLEEVLSYLAEHLKKQYDFKKKVQSALLYPEIILATALLVGAGISLFVLPQLIDLFESLHVKLPLATQFLLGTARFMKVYGILFFGALFGFILLLQAAIRLPKIRPLWDLFMFAFPVIGGYLNQIELASFCRNLGMMLKSGLPITNALEILSTSTDNTVYQGYIIKMQAGVKRGSTLFHSMDTQKMSFIPALASRMIRVGEKTGNLDENLLYLGDFFEEEIDVASKDFATVLEPIILVMVAAVVAFLAFAIISPIYEFTSAIK
jgi:type II secretory pathway component PulF